MDNFSFKSIVSNGTGEINDIAIIDKNINDLPEGDVLIKVAYSGLNYKDALSARGHVGITKKYPHTPGIDLSGVVVDSNNDNFQSGTKVLVTGYDLGMNTSGGFQEFVKVPSAWVVKLPKNLTLKQAMIYGTAGFTSALAFNRFAMLGSDISSGKLLITGATGGVGILSVAIAKKIGYYSVASTGKIELSELLRELGADEVIDRNSIIDETKRPLLSRNWKFVIESAGGITLNSAIRSLDKGGAVAIIGNVTGDEIHTSVYPFLLRGIALLGIESAETNMELRLSLWDKLANEWRIDNFEKIHKLISLEEVPTELGKMLQGTQSQKVVVAIDKSLDK
jgi:putative YhdH/YhfP family quinone oxidoreductase